MPSMFSYDAIKTQVKLRLWERFISAWVMFMPKRLHIWQMGSLVSGFSGRKAILKSSMRNGSNSWCTN